MRIRFLLLDAYGAGGSARAVIGQAGALAAAGHEVELVSVWRRRETPVFAVDGRVDLRALLDVSAAAPAWRRHWESPALRAPSRLVPSTEPRHHRFNRLTDRRIVHYLRSLTDGIVVGTRPALNLLIAQCAPEGVAKVGREDLPHAHHAPALAQAIEETYRRLDAVTVLTKADERAYRAALTVSDVRIARIPDPLHGLGGRRARPRRPVVVAAGRPAGPRGFDRMITAFARVARDHPAWQLRILGSGTETNRLRDLVHTRRLHDHVQLKGATAQLDEELATASLCVLGSRHEGSETVLAEAMSHGVPVIGYGCPEHTGEIITDDATGLLLAPDDTGGLTSCLIRLIEDESLRREMGDRAAAAAHRHGTELLRVRWEELFAALLDAKHGSELFVV